MISIRYWLPANSVVISYFVSWGFVGRLVLNILSMRSVMKNPPTTLLVAATMAMTPSTVANVLFLSPTRTMAPTTAMASRALVSDMSGVCSKGETWRMTSNPMKAASMNTNNALMMLDSILLPQGLKPRILIALYGTAEAVPFPNRPTEYPHRPEAKLPHRAIKRPSPELSYATLLFNRRAQIALSARWRQRQHFEEITYAGVHHFAATGDHGLANDFVLEIQLQLALFHHIEKESGDIAGV